MSQSYSSDRISTRLFSIFDSRQRSIVIEQFDGATSNLHKSCWLNPYSCRAFFMVLPSVILHSCMVRILGATQICALKVLDNQIVHLLVSGFLELIHLFVQQILHEAVWLADEFRNATICSQSHILHRH